MGLVLAFSLDNHTVTTVLIQLVQWMSRSRYVRRRSHLLQIVDQSKTERRDGRAETKGPLPSVRQLTTLQLTINPNTVARAYLELEHQGYLYKRQGQGTYVCTPARGAVHEQAKSSPGCLRRRSSRR